MIEIQTQPSAMGILAGRLFVGKLPKRAFLFLSKADFVGQRVFSSKKQAGRGIDGCWIDISRACRAPQAETPPLPHSG